MLQRLTDYALARKKYLVFFFKKIPQAAGRVNKPVVLMFVQMMLDKTLNLKYRFLCYKFGLVTKEPRAGTNMPPTRISVYLHESKAFKYN